MVWRVEVWMVTVRVVSVVAVVAVRAVSMDIPEPSDTAVPPGWTKARAAVRCLAVLAARRILAAPLTRTIRIRASVETRDLELAVRQRHARLLRCWHWRRRLDRPKRG